MLKVFQNKEENKEKGASLVEYGLLVALIAVVAIGAISFLGTNVSAKLSQVGQSISVAGGN